MLCFTEYYFMINKQLDNNFSIAKKRLVVIICILLQNVHLFNYHTLYIPCLMIIQYPDAIINMNLFIFQLSSQLEFTQFGSNVII